MQKGEGDGEESAKWKRDGKKEKGREVLSPIPSLFPFLSPTSYHFWCLHAGYHRRVYSSVKSLLAGATLACLTEVILFAFFRLGRHFSGMHAYWCIDSYAPISANKILIRYCIYFAVDGLEYQLVLSQVHVPRSYTRKVCLKIGLLEG